MLLFAVQFMYSYLPRSPVQLYFTNLAIRPLPQTIIHGVEVWRPRWSIMRNPTSDLLTRVKYYLDVVAPHGKNMQELRHTEGTYRPLHPKGRPSVILAIHFAEMLGNSVL
jgi:hypothetical protein